ncbi:endosome/lysosome-associated apoptosis and autophagy regulator family member 2-like [Lytechinus variegatus]|uniref:endosome/lysosome-associated apoptosis and autophagy regulator family member 2-like n=1 Tax=Lytechinus variegatus TaxID=7654 RepID=UPI001BB256B2|nr:endosome/lysosome-associated apoptosis and autophagy regulator family member 2-like [Lytechinus variegatus]
MMRNKMHLWLWYVALSCACTTIVLLGTAGEGFAEEDSGEPSPSTQPSLPTCQPDDFHYAMTECDENGVRWRVQVPQPDTCIGGAPAAPTRAVDCGFSCGAGEYLNIDSGSCRRCPKGKYSLGGGEKFTEWSELPPDFTVSSSAFYFTEDNERCNESYWEPIGSFVRSPDSTCSSKLIYTANLAKEGSVNFTYSLATDFNYFTVEVHNELCQRGHKSGGGKAVTATGEGEWKSVKLNLDAGLNVITWKSEGLYIGTGIKIPRVYIRSIEVMGLQYTSDCTKCPAGTFAAEKGSSSCNECPANTYSEAGASSCTDCDTATTYSVPGSRNCTTRKPCTEHDYYKIHTPCNENNQTQVKYKWIDPQLCNPNVPPVVQLPTSGKFQACPPCNPGMSISNKTECDYCPSNQFSDGTKPCQDCPPNTTPEYGMTFSYWNSLPPNMHASCVATTNDYGCASREGWVLAESYIHTGHGHSDDAYLILDLEVEGFLKEASYFNGKAEELGTISFAFSMECESEDCTLFFLEELNEANVIEYWMGSRERQEYRYAVTVPGKRGFTWAFQKTDVNNLDYDNNHRFPNDIVKIYDITITNTVNGGAASCKDCPLGSDHTGCIPCGPGQYIDENSKRCEKCPEDTYVRASDPVGKAACLECPSGLKSNRGESCYSNCHVRLNEKHYDLVLLQGQQSVMSGASFLTEGNAFYYHFNFSLCGKAESNLASCMDNSSAIGQVVDEGTMVNSWVCRSMMMPGSDDSKYMTAIKPISLGDTLLGINDGDSLGDITDTIILQPEEGLKDLKFYYHSPQTTKACPNGRSTIVTLRCDPSEKETNNIELPVACPIAVESNNMRETTVAQAGTCDGCTFHMLWTSQYACPVCTNDDIVAIKQECKHGHQVTKYVWNDTVKCVGGITLPEDKITECVVPPWYSQVPLYAQVAIAAFVGCAILLCAMIVCIWKKNRKLEYKYQKLVSSASGELPAADSCAIDEDDEDEVHFEDGSKNSRSFLSKFKSRGSSDKQGLLDGPDMEAFRMKDQPSIMTPLSETT